MLSTLVAVLEKLERTDKMGLMCVSVRWSESTLCALLRAALRLMLLGTNAQGGASTHDVVGTEGTQRSGPPSWTSLSGRAQCCATNGSFHFRGLMIGLRALWPGGTLTVTPRIYLQGLVSDARRSRRIRIEPCYI